MTRMTRTCISLGLLVAAAALAGCTNDQPLERDFGNSVVSNDATEIVNPVPLAGSQDFDTSGKRMVSAMDRYNRGKAYPPVPALSSIAPVGAIPAGTPGSQGGPETSSEGNQ